MTSVPTTKPPGKGWMPWGVGSGSPYDYAEVELWREGWHETILQHPLDNPWMNANGLYWRPAGPMLTNAERMRQALRTLFRE